MRATGRKHVKRLESDINRTPSQVYDDRPAQGRGSYVADGDPVDQVGRASLARMSIQSAAAPSVAGEHRIGMLAVVASQLFQSTD